MPYAEKSAALPPGYKSGRLRAYFLTKIAHQNAANAAAPSDAMAVILVAAVATVVRFYRLQLPPKIVFDETHFVGFAKEYYDGEFFVDVHPPLVKLVFYWIALACGWSGSHKYTEIGDIYDHDVPYVAMRLFSALCGVLTAVLAFLSLRASSCRPRIALVGALLVVFENSLATQSRLIMLDSGLVGFTSLAVLSFQKLANAVPFSRKWARLLLATGVALGLAVSTKLTGVFTIAWCLLLSAYQIWLYVGDLEVSLSQVLVHVVLRLMAFVAVPLTIYCGFFSIHFMLLPRNGTGSGIMSPSFKADFEDSTTRNTAVDVSYGSTVIIKHHRLDTYLHSHDYRYESGTREQQVTMYGFQDDPNSQWVLETHGENYDGKFDTKFRPIKDGDTVKLYHKGTQRYLRANDVRPPNSEHDYSNEVSCKGNRTDTAEINYEWKVKIVGKKPHAKNELPLRKLRATESVFQLIHRGTLCKLMGQDVKLPDWGFNQNQVLCMNDPTLPNTLWYIESNSHPVIDGDESYPRVDLPQLSLFRKMLEYHHSMWRINKGFTKKHVYSSEPVQWPFVQRGINYFSNGHGHEKLTDEKGSHIYFLGNIVVYYAGILALLAFSFKFVFHVLARLNPYKTPVESPNVSTYYWALFAYASGWALHYFPYFLISRQLFVHHYLTSVYFLILTLAQLAEYEAQYLRAWPLALEGLLAGAVFFFYKLSPLIYGFEWTVQQCQRAKLFSSWDFDCMAYSH